MDEFSVSSFPPVLVRCFGTCPIGMPPLFSMIVLPVPPTWKRERRDQNREQAFHLIS